MIKTTMLRAAESSESAQLQVERDTFETMFLEADRVARAITKALVEVGLAQSILTEAVRQMKDITADERDYLESLADN